MARDRKLHFHGEMCSTIGIVESKCVHVSLVASSAGARCFVDAKEDDGMSNQVNLDRTRSALSSTRFCLVVSVFSCVWWPKNSSEI